MKLALDIEGTQSELANILGMFGDAGLQQSIHDFSATLAVFGQQLEAIMADLNQQTADIQIISDALASANSVLANVSADTGNLLTAAAANAARIAELEALVAALPGSVDTTALDAGIAAAKAQATVLLEGLNALDAQVPVPNP